MKKIIFVSHCILNTASKVVLYNQTDMDAEENLRKKFMHKAIDQEVQIIQLPCPEFTLYGPKRWGHVSMNRPPEVRPKNLTIGGRFSYGKI